MSGPFVVPEVVRLPLPSGEWINVKKELTFGEQEEMFARMRRQFGPQEVPVLDTTKIGRARMEAYIVGWSFLGPNGQPAAVTPSALGQLTTETARAIREALEQHEERLLEERELEKNAQGGATVSSPISPSAK